MPKETTLKILRSVLRSKAAVEQFVTANPGVSDEALLDRAIAMEEERAVVKRKTKEVVRRENIDKLKTAVATSSPTKLLFLARAIIHCGLPHRRTKARELVKKARLGNGQTLSVTFKASMDGIDLPFGRDRALLAWITTCAKVARSPRITFKTASEFLKAFGLSDSGSQYKAFRASLDRLRGFSCFIQVGSGDYDGSLHESVIKRAVVPSRNDVHHECSGEQRLIDPGSYYIELDDSFFDEIVKHAMPMPIDAMKLFHNNPTAWDFLQFLAYRTAAARSFSRIPFDELLALIGTTDSNKRRLRATFESLIKEFKEFWPDLNAHFEGDTTDTFKLIVGPAPTTLVPRKAPAALAEAYD